MYAIPFVLSILMLLSILSYTNLHSFLHFHITQNEYQYYMRDSEQGDYNSEVKRRFDNRSDSTNKIEEEDDSPNQKKPRLNGTLNLFTWMNPLASEEDKRQCKMIFERLLDQLYKNHPSFAAFYEKQPDLNTQIIARLENKERPPQCNLCSIELNSKLLQDAFAMMVNGNITADAWNKRVANGESLEGYFRSLNDFVSCTSTSKPVSIYLAKKELLLAIYQDPVIVNAIILERNDCYSKPNNSKSEDSKAPSNEILTIRLPPDFIDNFFTFSISGTKPPDYVKGPKKT
jgi:hypothetical protein